jgi:hypothetical protein
MRTFVITWDCCFSVVNAEDKEELFNTIKELSSDGNFNLVNGKFHFKWVDDGYNEEVDIVDVTDKKGEIFGGSFG